VRPGDRRLLVALAASAAAHSVVLAALWSRRGTPSQPASSGPGARALQVALVQRRPGPPPPPVAAPPPAGAPPRPASAAKAVRPAPGRRAPERPQAAGRAPDDLPSSRPPSPPPSPGPAPGTPGWLEAEGLARDEAAAAAVLSAPLRLGHDPAGRPGAGPWAKAPVETREEAAARAGRRLDALLDDQLAADRAAMAADPYWTALRERLERDLGGVLGRGPAEDALGSAGHLAGALAAWQRRAERWARTAQVDPGHGPGVEERGDPGRPGPTEPGTVGAREEGLLATELVTRVEIVQGPDGAVVAVRLAGGSGNADHDRLVLRRFEELGAEAREWLGPPPAQGRRTRWAVSTRFEVVPPLPVVGCGFDATFRPTGCFYPLKRSVKSSARLERIFAGE
jgi:hypothetical protein